MKGNILIRPPFKFLHDLLAAVIEAQKFPIGLFAAEEMDAENVKDKNQKLAFLNKLVGFVNQCLNEDVPVNPKSIVRGEETDKTNLLLQKFADCVRLKDQINLEAVLTNVHSRFPVSTTVPLSTAAAPATPQPSAPTPQPQAPTPVPPAAAPSPSLQPAQPAAQPPPRPAPSPAPVPPAAAPSPVLAPAAAPSPARRPGPDPALPPSLQSTGSSSRISLPGVAAKLESPDAPFWDLTLKILEPVVDRPKPNQKLLSKPPVAYIRDTAVAIFKKINDLPVGYFTSDELTEQKLDTNTKLSVLQKLVDYVEAWRNCDPPLRGLVDPKKVAGGKNPEITNYFLQQLALAAAHSTLSSAEVLAKLRSAPAATPSIAPAAPVVAAPSPVLAPSSSGSLTSLSLGKAGPVPVRPPSSAAIANAMRAAEEKPAPSKPAESAASDFEVPATRGDLGRPKTARPAPPKVKTNIIEEEKKEEKAKEAGAGVILEGDKADDEEDDMPEEIEKLKGFEGGDEVEKEAAALHGEKHGQLVESMLKQMQKAGVMDEKKESQETGLIIKHRLGGSKASAAANYNKEQILLLRQSVQNMCQSVNPLGKCMEFVFEDVDQMTKELARWRRAYTEYTEQLEQEKITTTKILEPLQDQLNDMDAQIADQKKKISQLKAAVARQDVAIQQLIEQKATMG